jgi:hypothetical protein
MAYTKTESGHSLVLKLDRTVLDEFLCIIGVAVPNFTTTEP